jgi:RHS repeat-associated protein
MTRRTTLVGRALLLALFLPITVSAQTPTAVEYYHLDAVGSVRAVTDQSGAVVRTHNYFPFGEGDNPTAGNDAVRFTGQERDAETGLDYFGARYYASRTGRFTTVDPVYTWQENLVDPQRWNRYAYVRNNPLRFTDPDGRAIDIIADIAFIAYDLFDIGRSVIRGEGISGTQAGALGADILGAAIPFGTGGGAALRAAAKAEKAAGGIDTGAKGPERRRGFDCRCESPR